jgi:acyl-CoA reductase-like NAD-dependent aldehyde dehydrogenase
MPLVFAIASGNTAILKPSEMAAESAKLIEKMVHEALDNDCYRVVNGAKQTSL